MVSGALAQSAAVQVIRCRDEREHLVAPGNTVLSQMDGIIGNHGLIRQALAILITLTSKLLQRLQVG